MKAIERLTAAEIPRAPPEVAAPPRKDSLTPILPVLRLSLCLVVAWICCSSFFRTPLLPTIEFA